MSAISEKINHDFKAGDDIRDAGLTTPSNVIRYDNICYGTDTVNQLLDVYRPRFAQERTLPVIISVHGGGWVYGDKERYQYYCMSLAQQGFVVINFTYRLAPEFKFPAPLEDTNLVLHWLKENAATYQADLQNIFAVGDSAGGNDLGLTAAILSNPEYAKEFDFTAPSGIKFNAIALNCPAVYITMDRGEQDLFHDLMLDYLPEKGTPEEVSLLDIRKYVTSQYPPVFLMTCPGDHLKEVVPTLIPVLEQNDVPFVYRRYGSRSNPLTHVFHCNMYLAEAAQCNEDECNFFKSYINY